MNELGIRTEVLIRRSLPEEMHQWVRNSLLEYCSARTLGNSGWSQSQMERIWFAVMKLGGSDPEELQNAVQLARQDWRDLLVAAGFDADPSAHNIWWSRVCG